MQNFVKLLIGLSALGFVLAIISVLFTGGSIAGVDAEGFSRGCTNLALIAIALTLCFKEGGKET